MHEKFCHEQKHYPARLIIFCVVLNYNSLLFLELTEDHKSTQKNYDTPSMRVKFCDWLRTKTVSMSEVRWLNFTALCHECTHLNTDLPSKASTATMSFHKDNGMSFNRKQHPSSNFHCMVIA